MMPFCDRCGRYAMELKFHKCPPVYEVHHPEFHGEEWEEVWAYDEEEAATEWTEKEDRESAEYTVANGAQIVVWVREKGTVNVKKFRVSAEVVPVYSASEVDEVE